MNEMTETEGSAADRLAVIDVLNRYATAIDTRDWTKLDEVFAEDAVGDFTSFGGRDEMIGREAIVAGIRAVIDGFEVTQHLLGNQSARIDGDTAHLTAYIHAVHILTGGRGDPEYTIGGRYEIDLNRTPFGWRAIRHVLLVTWDRGNRDLVRRAAARARKTE
jgi:uncharacterized protein (TIGR02246 family)